MVFAMFCVQMEWKYKGLVIKLLHLGGEGGWSAKGYTFVGGFAGVYARGGPSGHMSLAAGNYINS